MVRGRAQSVEETRQHVKEPTTHPKFVLGLGAGGGWDVDPTSSLGLRLDLYCTGSMSNRFQR